MSTAHINTEDPFEASSCRQLVARKYHGVLCAVFLFFAVVGVVYSFFYGSEENSRNLYELTKQVGGSVLSGLMIYLVFGGALNSGRLRGLEFSSSGFGFWWGEKPSDKQLRFFATSQMYFLRFACCFFGFVALSILASDGLSGLENMWPIGLIIVGLIKAHESNLLKLKHLQHQAINTPEI